MEQLFTRLHRQCEWVFSGQRKRDNKLVKIELPKLAANMAEAEELEVQIGNAVREETELNGYHFHHESACGVPAQRLEVSGCVFENCRFSSAIFHDASFSDVIFRNCEISNVDYSECFFRRVVFEDSKMIGSNFAEAILCGFKSVQFEESKLIGIEFLHTPLTGIDFTTNEIDGIQLSGEELRGAIVTPVKACDLSRLLGLVIR